MYLIAAVIIVAFLVWIARDRVRFDVTIRDGKLSVQRGDLPVRLRQDFADVLRHVRQGRVRGRQRGDRIELTVNGDIDELTLQRLRNVLGVHLR